MSAIIDHGWSDGKSHPVLATMRTKAAPIPCQRCEGARGDWVFGPSVGGYNSAGAPYPTERWGDCSDCGGRGTELCVHCGEHEATVWGPHGPECEGCIYGD